VVSRKFVSAKEPGARLSANAAVWSIISIPVVTQRRMIAAIAGQLNVHGRRRMTPSMIFCNSREHPTRHPR
jgi:hypothetical protein